MRACPRAPYTSSCLRNRSGFIVDPRPNSLLPQDKMASVTAATLMNFTCKSFVELTEVLLSIKQ